MIRTTKSKKNAHHSGRTIPFQGTIPSVSDYVVFPYEPQMSSYHLVAIELPGKVHVYHDLVFLWIVNI